jgi:putative DNA primase/helicase
VGTLGTRFLAMSNETPAFADNSGALGNRMVMVKFNESFLGREDSTLTAKLMTELPGILNWALTGLDRLTDRGFFTQPLSGEEEKEETKRMGNSAYAFATDWCAFGEGLSATLGELYDAYVLWCKATGREKHQSHRDHFSKNLLAAFPKEQVRKDRPRVDGKRVPTFLGLTVDALNPATAIASRIL